MGWGSLSETIKVRKELQFSGRESENKRVRDKIQWYAGHEISNIKDSIHFISTSSFVHLLKKLGFRIESGVWTSGVATLPGASTPRRQSDIGQCPDTSKKLTKQTKIQNAALENIETKATERLLAIRMKLKFTTGTNRPVSMASILSGSNLLRENPEKAYRVSKRLPFTETKIYVRLERNNSSFAEFHINVSVDNKSEAVFTGIETQNSLSGLSQAIDYHESMHRHTCVRYSFASFLLLLYFRTWSIKRDESTIGPRDRSSREYESVFR
ncbi:hypothetical protein KQX54_002909 [Cotesia glomerata]|uniref:Uncharacterized protein n=1 Tax=Cotesia glomerata TaxID=32391 RepID=A0AAV7IVE0_COTGL|nr:hypothetical protein KQX54_002909 [Cotesia glomerata]